MRGDSVTIRLEEAGDRKLNGWADKAGVTRAEMVRIALEHYDTCLSTPMNQLKRRGF